MTKIEYIQLLDLYGKLLTENQQDVMNLYYNLDLSLSEIAQSKNVSRQSVSECINKSRKQLEEFEEKLCFNKEFSLLESKYFALSEKVVHWAEKQKASNPSLQGELTELVGYIGRE